MHQRQAIFETIGKSAHRMHLIGAVITCVLGMLAFEFCFCYSLSLSLFLWPFFTLKHQKPEIHLMPIPSELAINFAIKWNTHTCILDDDSLDLCPMLTNLNMYTFKSSMKNSKIIAPFFSVGYVEIGFSIENSMKCEFSMEEMEIRVTLWYERRKGRKTTVKERKKKWRKIMHWSLLFFFLHFVCEYKSNYQRVNVAWT